MFVLCANNQILNKSHFLLIIMNLERFWIWNALSGVMAVFSIQVDLKHMHQEPGNNVVAMGIDLTEFYLRLFKGFDLHIGVTDPEHFDVDPDPPSENLDKDPTKIDQRIDF